MTKAKLFDYRDSRDYCRRYGINPEKHFDMLCGKYGTDAAVDIVDRNMIKIWRKRIKEAGEKDGFEHCGRTESPFPT